MSPPRRLAARRARAPIGARPDPCVAGRRLAVVTGSCCCGAGEGPSRSSRVGSAGTGSLPNAAARPLPVLRIDPDWFVSWRLHRTPVEVRLRDQRAERGCCGLHAHGCCACAGSCGRSCSYRRRCARTVRVRCAGSFIDLATRRRSRSTKVSITLADTWGRQDPARPLIAAPGACAGRAQCCPGPRASPEAPTAGRARVRVPRFLLDHGIPVDPAHGLLSFWDLFSGRPL